MWTMILGFGASWWKALVGFLVAAPLFFLLGQCDGRRSQQKVDAAARAEANVQAMKVNAGATEKAAEERVALGCKRLLAQGTDPAHLPAACGPRR
jgi:hypothetical protein